MMRHIYLFIYLFIFIYNYYFFICLLKINIYTICISWGSFEFEIRWAIGILFIGILAVMLLLQQPRKITVKKPWIRTLCVQVSAICSILMSLIYSTNWTPICLDIIPNLMIQPLIIWQSHPSTPPLPRGEFSKI